MPETTLIFGGGGTGGHLYPALAIAEAARRLEPGIRAVFVCSRRTIDADVLRGAREEFVALPAKPFSLRPRGLAAFLRGWGASVRECRRLIRDARNGGGVRLVATGGFVAAPFARAAAAEGTPLLLVNLDALPGKANRWIARRAGRGVRVLTTARPVAPVPRPDHWHTIPPIVRSAALASAPSAVCRARLGLSPDAPTLVVTGGSQGARSINGFVLAVLAANPGAFLRPPEGRPWQVLHQCGKSERERVADAYAAAGVRALVQEFSDCIGDWWGAADLAVCRAGAGTIGELWANTVPALLLPYPHHRDDHQRANAAVLVDAGGAVVARDMVDSEATAAAAGPILVSLLLDPPRRARMRGGLANLGPADGAETAAREALTLKPTTRRVQSP